MSTNGMTSWAVDLAEVAAIYPFNGWIEVPLYIAGLIAWLGWHVYQMRQEAVEIEQCVEADKSGDHTRAAIERY